MNAEDPNENSSIVNKNDSVKTELPPIAPEFDASEIENHLRNKLSSKKESVTIENQKKDYSFGMFITNITLTGATICLVFFGYFQFSTYKDAVQTEFRAYINPKVYCSIVAQNHDSILFLVNYGVNFENIGKIPAQKFAILFSTNNCYFCSNS